MGKGASRWSVFGAALAGVLTGVLVVTLIPAVAANGDPLVLGDTNKAGRSTWLTSRGASTLKVNNTAGYPPLQLKSQDGAAPLAVDSNTRVDNLNADLLDGKDSSEYARALRGVPSGAVMFFDRSTCPAGWSAYSTAAGRMIVGVPTGGTLEGLNGAALANLGDPVTANSGAHNHPWTIFYGAGQKNWKTYAIDGTPEFLFAYGLGSDGVGTEGAGIYPLAPHNDDESSDMVYYTGYDTNPGQYFTGHTHNVDLPYVQLLACEKN